MISSIENPDYERSKSTFRILPDTCVELFLNYNSNTAIAKIKAKSQFDSSGSFVTSRMSTFMDIQVLPGSGAIAVCFKPGAAFHFFNLPMKELSDNNVLLVDVWGNKILELEEYLSACCNNAERALLIQQFLFRLIRNKLERKKEYEYCLWQVNLFKGQMAVHLLSKKTNISQRQLSRQFNSFLGLSPKAYSRVTRFLCSIDIIKRNPSASLTQIAYESGYFDQAHFIHDCKEFAGMTPKELICSGNVIC